MLGADKVESVNKCDYEGLSPVLLELLGQCEQWCRVGSRVSCDPPPSDTDCDLLLLVDDYDGFVDQAVDDGWERAGSKIDDATDSTRSPFVSLVAGEFNLIVTEDKDFYRRFVAATRVATRLNLMDKGDRVALFQAVLYGNS